VFDLTASTKLVTGAARGDAFSTENVFVSVVSGSTLRVRGLIILVADIVFSAGAASTVIVVIKLREEMPDAAEVTLDTILDTPCNMDEMPSMNPWIRLLPARQRVRPRLPSALLTLPGSPLARETTLLMPPENADFAWDHAFLAVVIRLFFIAFQ